MEPSKGWICLYRSIKEHWLWEEKPFDKRSAWIDLLLSVNHKDKKVLIGNQLAVVKAGSFITSELKLMDRWGWSKRQVRNFLDILESDNMIVKESTKKWTTINVVRWQDLQDLRTTTEPQQNGDNGNNTINTITESTKKRTTINAVKRRLSQDLRTTTEPQPNHNRTTTGLQPDTNNNDNNDNNDNNGNNPPSFSQEYITDNPIEYFEQNITLVRNEIDKEQILDAVNEKGFVAFKRAVDISKKQGGRSLGYCLKVLYNSKNASKKKINDVTGSAEEVARLLREKGDYYKL